MMWSWVSVREGRKDSAGLMRRAFFVRLDEETWRRHSVQMKFVGLKGVKEGRRGSVIVFIVFRAIAVLALS